MNRIRAAIASALAVACLVGGTVTAVADADAVAKAQAELERILASGELSSDVYEVVSKSLA